MSEVVGIKLPSELFKGQTAIVTGASRGVGKATVLRLAEAGANVVVNYLKEKERAEEVVKMCEEQGVRAIS
ncbi:MAG: SDR family NAD(P)-dependent oxidoreductase, partial [Pyrinomonadaceae bacterium]